MKISSFITAKIDKRQSIFYSCCYSYGVSGVAVLVIGAVFPSIIAEAGISFLAAGGLLSSMAVGTFLASFLYPMMISFMGKRVTVTLMSILTPVCLFLLTLLPHLPVLYGIMLIYGLTRGCISIINNGAVNDLYEEDGAGKLNMLHCTFAIGAFIAPLLTALFMALGLDWKAIIYMVVGVTATSAVTYAIMDYGYLDEAAKPIFNIEKANRKEDHSYLRSFQFYCISFLLFFYLGVENCINGWFVTYLQNTGVMSAAYATALVSVTWLVIMIGRIVCASLSRSLKMSSIILLNAVGSAVCFFILISTKNLVVITAALAGFGFFLAGIYPTCIADVGRLIHGSTFGISLLTAISAIGGIVTPQIVGGAADYMGIVAAIGILAVNVVLVVLFAAVNAVKPRNPV